MEYSKVICFLRLPKFKKYPSMHSEILRGKLCAFHYCILKPESAKPISLGKPLSQFPHLPVKVSGGHTSGSSSGGTQCVLI